MDNIDSQFDFFDFLNNVIDDAIEYIDKKARFALNKEDHYTVLQSFSFASKTIRDRYPPFKVFLNQSLCRLLDNMVEALSHERVKGKPIKEAYRHITQMCNELNHLKIVIADYRRSAQRSHMFDDTGLVEVDNRLVFIAMPFEPADEMNRLHNAIRSAILEYDSNLTPRRADDFAGDRLIYDTITKKIRQCSLLIAAVHGSNSNVYFELGYARALRKKVFTIAERREDLKFDVQHSNCIIERNPENVRQRLTAWLRESY